jgi:hypothetical protein
MSPSDPRVDTYIANAAAFAQPLLREIRQRVHAGCAQAEEAIKWGMPAFVYKGKRLCGMAAFKAHATLGFWQQGNAANGEAMGQYGRLCALGDLPGRREFTHQLQQAMQRIDSGVPAAQRAPRPPLPMPEAFAAALTVAPAAKAVFDGFAPGYQRDYLEWIAEAKRDSTRQHRITQAIVWLGEGKRRHWKHEQR